MTATKVDYKQLRDLFVTEGKGYRELSRMFPISHSVIADRGRKEDWPGQRQAYQASLARRSYEVAADAVGHEQAQIQKESILVARAYIRTFAGQLQAGTINTNAKDTVEFIKLLANELNPARGEVADAPKVIEGTALPVGDADFLRRVVELARERTAPAGVLGPGPLGDPSDSRPN